MGQQMDIGKRDRKCTQCCSFDRRGAHEKGLEWDTLIFEAEEGNASSQDRGGTGQVGIERET